MHKPSLLYQHLFAKALILDSEALLQDDELMNLYSECRHVMAPLRELLKGEGGGGR